MSLESSQMGISSANSTDLEVKPFQNGILVGTGDKDALNHGIEAVSTQSKWVSVQISGRKPSPRYQVTLNQH